MAKEEEKEEISYCSLLEKSIEELSYPLNWEKNGNFHAPDRKITKLHGDNYRKISSQKPLEGYELYRFKFRVIKMGTVAIGLVPQQYNKGYFINGGKENVLKYVAFQNSKGGVINFNKSEIVNGPSLALREGDAVELIFDSKMMVVTLKSSRMPKAETIDIGCFRGLKLYLFVEMKLKDTCIEFY